MTELLLENIKVYDRFIKKNNLYQTGQINLLQIGGDDSVNMDPFYSENIEELTKQNNDYRRVIFTGKNQQLVLMSIPPKDDIKMETHIKNDQFVRIEQGEGEAIIGNKTYKLQDNTAFIVPAGVQHQIINTSESEPLKLYSIYSPPEHEDKLIQNINPDKKENNDTKITDKQVIIKPITEESIEIIENELNKLRNNKTGGISNYNRKNIDYEMKYKMYKNNYVLLKNFISKYH
jgi:mannose-6-phosphate isomerase-like protein (cupin superfamily)